VPVENLRLCIIISLHCCNATLGGASGFRIAIRKPSADFVVILGGVNYGCYEFIIGVSGEVDFCAAGWGDSDGETGKLFEVTAGGLLIVRVEKQSRFELEGLGLNAFEFEPAIRVGLVDFVDLAVFVFFAFEEFGDFLCGKTYAGMVAEVDDIQADVSFAVLQLWQFHIAYFNTDFADCTDFFDVIT
jgi:hypothetical protein